MSLLSPSNYGLLGIFFIIISFTYWFMPINHFIVFTANALFYVGNILLFDYLSYKFSGKSLLTRPRKKARLTKQIYAVGLLGGLMLEIYVHWIAKLWYYPYWKPWFYALVFIPGFAVYYLYLFETYLGTKAVIKHYFPELIPKKRKFHDKRILFGTLGLVGVLGLIALTIYSIKINSFGNSFQTFLRIIYSPFPHFGSFWLYILPTFFFWFIYEFIEHKRKEQSLITEILNKNFIPIISLFVSSIFSAFLYETLNVPGGLWRYANIPFTNIAFLGVPILIPFLWILHYLPVFALWRILFKEDTQDIWY